MKSALSAHHAAMRRYRFHAPDVSGSVVIVTGDEARHAATVLRLKPGDEVDLFDGQGAEAAGLVRAIDSESMTVAITLRMTKAPSSLVASTSLILATAIPKGARADWMIEKCAELGVAELRPIQFERSVVDPGAGKVGRWRRLALAAAKQCGSTTVMSIREPSTLDELLKTLGRSAGLYGLPRMRESLSDRLFDIGRNATRPESVMVLVGPEGGLSPTEITSLDHAGVVPVSWASTILRVETAAIAAAAVFASHAAGFAPVAP